MNRIHMQIYDSFIISGSHFSDISFGQTRRIIFPDGNDAGVSGKIRFNVENETSSIVLNVDEIENNYFFISVSRNNQLVGNIHYSGRSELDVNGQFNISEADMRMLHNNQCVLHRSSSMHINIGNGELTRIDFRLNTGPYFAVVFGANGPMMCRANGNVGIPILRNLVRAEAEKRIHERAEIITREFLTRFLCETENLPQDAEGLLAEIFKYTGMDRFLRN